MADRTKPCEKITLLFRHFLEGDSYDVTVAPEKPLEMPTTELAIPDENADITEAPIDHFNFQKMLQEQINEHMMKAVQPGERC